MATNASPAVDMDLKKAFQELQYQAVTTKDKVQSIQMEIESLKRASMIRKITSRTLEGLGSEPRTFESVGRTFVLRDKEALKNKIIASIKDNEEKVKSLEKNKEYLETKVKESENNLREMINQKRNVSAK